MRERTRSRARHPARPWRDPAAAAGRRYVASSPFFLCLLCAHITVFAHRVSYRLTVDELKSTGSICRPKHPHQLRISVLPYNNTDCVRFSRRALNESRCRAAFARSARASLLFGVPLGFRENVGKPRSRCGCRAFVFAGVPGLEPRTTVPETAVLPITPYPNWQASQLRAATASSYLQPDLNRCWRRERA